MLPHTKGDKSNKTIYINPNFKGHLRTPENTSLPDSNVIPKNAHINPLFLAVHKFRSTIHMNPAFLQKLQDNQIQHQRKILENSSQNCSIVQADNVAINLCEKSACVETRKIICKSKNRLIREPISRNDNHLLGLAKHFPLQPLIALNKRKLIRKSSVVQQQTFNKLETNGFNGTQNRITRYKLDNRMIRKKPILPPTPRFKKTPFVGRYALKRNSISETSNAINKRFILTNKNKNLQVLNINGLLYKSTRNSLKLKDIKNERELKLSNSITSAEKPSPNTNQGLTIFVRGNKYVMDHNKFKLTRISNCNLGSPDRMTNKNSFNASLCKRIDIGGYTYVSSNSAKNVLIRTTNHLSRAYVHNAKQKSLQTLIRRLVKTNIPCLIFRRIGKCAAFERGKCSKVHNKLQVAICSKFLRGECINSSCLLSHNVSLSKMPVCKFFLQGVCVRNDCPYLHKKLSNTAQLCTDFLRGFCQMADKCDKRHEFVCPEIERNNICTAKNCIHCNTKKRREAQIATKLGKLENNIETISTLSLNSSAEYAENQNCKRYFIDSSDVAKENANKGSENCTNEENAITTDITECCEDNIEKSLKTRPKLGILPSYIPL